MKRNVAIIGGGQTVHAARRHDVNQVEMVNEAVRAALAVMLEARFATMAAVIAGFGRVIAEVGCSLMVGGNIRWYTRSMTTAIALETSKGEFGFALAIGIILLAVALAANILLHSLQLEKA